MSESMTATAPEHHEGHEGHEDTHPADGYYVRIAVILAVITGLEVALSYLGAPTVIEVGGLLVMMSIKFFLVAAHFMHLRFDSKVLTRLFYAGLFLAVFVYVVALSTFELFLG